MINKKFLSISASPILLALALITASYADTHTCKVKINIAGQWQGDKVTFSVYPQGNRTTANIQSLGTFSSSSTGSFQCFPGNQYVIIGTYTVKTLGQPTGATYPHESSAFEATPDTTYHVNWPSGFGAPTMPM